MGAHTRPLALPRRDPRVARLRGRPLTDEAIADGYVTRLVDALGVDRRACGRCGGGRDC